MKEFDSVRIKNSNITGVICHEYDTPYHYRTFEVEVFGLDGTTLFTITMYEDQLELIKDEDQIHDL